ncbi:class II aldolase/adducin family protein [Paenibacillus ferrarius]|uniref:class II aldolase/adducin family protein n=1 Tax=Paenibacillus ferrarius TaxID=1469647 RepID=UPI003D2E9505
MSLNLLKHANELINTGKYLLDENLAWGNSGNMSCRLDENYMLITGSGTNMGDLRVTDLVEVNIPSGSYAKGEKKPSKEIPMHAAIYQARPETTFIIHSSPFWSTFAACSSMVISNELFIESMYYAEKIAYVDYFHPGSQELGKAVGTASEKADVLFLKNHGIIVFDTSMQEAKMRIETIEMTCRMIAVSRMTNIPLNQLPSSVVADFLDNSGYKPRRKL